MDLSQNPFMITFLYLWSLGKAFLRYKDPNRKQAFRHMDEFYDRAWRDATDRLGGVYEPIGAGISEIVRGRTRTRVYQSTCAIDDPVTHLVASNKPLTYKLLARDGLPTPRHLEFSLSEMAKAIGFLESEGRECVVKPASGTGGGRGITTGIKRRWHLVRAAAAAAVYGDRLLIEEQVEGDNYRLLYLDGVLLDAFLRRPPNVIADGRSSIRHLVRVSNQARLRHGYGLSQGLLTIDLDMRRTLAKRGFSLGTIPSEGTVVNLKTVINENCGSDNATADHMLCDAIIEEGARAARALQVRLAGIDVITKDPSVSLTSSRGAILEVNTSPNFYFHYHKRDGAFPVSIHVLEALLAERSTKSRSSVDAGYTQEARFPC